MLTSAVQAVAAEERGNFFNDPFLQAAQPFDHVRRDGAQAHSRITRGASCFQPGRYCPPNFYLYDREIFRRVKKAVLADGRFTDASVWIEGQRRQM